MSPALSLALSKEYLMREALSLILLSTCKVEASIRPSVPAGNSQKKQMSYLVLISSSNTECAGEVRDSAIMFLTYHIEACHMTAKIVGVIN